MLFNASLSVNTSPATRSAAATTLMLANGAALNHTSPRPTAGTETRMHMPMTESTMAIDAYARTGSAWRPTRGGALPGIFRTRANARSARDSKLPSSASRRATLPPRGFMPGSSAGPRCAMSPDWNLESSAARRSAAPGSRAAASMPGRRKHSNRHRLRRLAPRRRTASPASPAIRSPRTWRSLETSAASQRATSTSPASRTWSSGTGGASPPGARRETDSRRVPERRRRPWPRQVWPTRSESSMTTQRMQ
mmetsp:Transcript_92245/g.257816  ORF Transcript_92245/g.257816 Transcript_92245/m.257816 type:complete len:251 (-) Transcript_92245:773-1525(-)